MRTVNILWGLASGCAVLLLFAPLTPRTRWLPTGRNATGVSLVTEGVGWQGIAALVGIAALTALVMGRRARGRAPAAAVGAGLATIGFAVVAVGMTRHWIDLMNGITSVHPGEGWTLHPAPMVPLFAVLAGAGACLALAVTISWARPAAETDITSAAG